MAASSSRNIPLSGADPRECPGEITPMPLYYATLMFQAAAKGRHGRDDGRS